MRIYIIRHGITENNASGIRQSREGFLSQEGIAQARALSDKLSELTIDSIFTSPYPRARQTADIISAAVKGLQVQESEYLTEVRYPSEVIGKSKTDPESVRILEKIQGHYGEEGWRYSDEETFEEFVERAHTVLDYLSKTGFKNVVVVSHERFIRVLVGVVLLGREFTPGVFKVVRKNLYVSNTGITICEQFKNEGGPWRLMQLNDHSHVTGLAHQLDTAQHEEA
jgi:broad specificity phosphatase PhoE